MPATVQSITTIQDIPQLLATFADSAGFSAAMQAGGACRVTLPGGADTYDFVVTADTMSWTGPNASKLVKAVSHVPMLKEGASGLIAATPTKVFFFANSGAAPYLAMVVSFGYNRYRHLYLGRIEKVGAYGGGDVISATQPVGGFYTTSFGDFGNYNRGQFLFASRYQRPFIGEHGGVKVQHASNPQLWRAFKDDDGQTYAQDRVLGGFGDGFNDWQLARGRSSYAGSNLLVPINLFMPVDGEAFAPIGTPNGVAGVNMQDILPEAQVKVGNLGYRVFPAWVRTELAAEWVLPNGYVPENSFYVGYAYRDETFD